MTKTLKISNEVYKRLKLYCLIHETHINACVEKLILNVIESDELQLAIEKNGREAFGGSQKENA